MKKVVILGAGISGLSLGWFLKKRYGAYLDIQILEKSSRPGGWIQSLQVEGAVFEQGPRSCRTVGNGVATLNLIEELGLSDQIILPHPSAQHRYIYSKNRLQKLPNGMMSLIKSPFKGAIIRGLWKDWKTPQSKVEDETIYNFICRRLNSEIADNFIDPLTLGIYAGNIHELSAHACFPDWIKREQAYGGLIRSLWKSPRNSNIQKYSLFSLRYGMESLIKNLADKLKDNIIYNSSITALKYNSDKIHIYLNNGQKIEVDYVCSTLPAHALGSLLNKYYPKLAEFPLSIPHASLAVFNLAYTKLNLPYQGFGYLIPTKENELALGVVFDSCIFPGQNGSFNTRLSILLGGSHHPEIESYSDDQLRNAVLNAVHRQLNIDLEPDFIHIKKCYTSIPQYLVGYERHKNIFFEKMAKMFPRLSILGMGFNGVSVNDCIAQAKFLSDQYGLQK